MNIKEIYKINNLSEKVKILYNNYNLININKKFYSNYLKNDVSWLIDNQEKINQDFYNNINILKFDIILNSNLDERFDLILKINDIEEFTKYVSIVPFRFLKNRAKNRIIKQYSKFISLEDYEKIKYFDSIKRW